MTDLPAAPVTLDELIVRWAERDAEYAKQRTPMAPDQEAAVRHMRLQEAGSLPNVAERARAHARAYSWVPPVHAEFGSMKEWVQ